MVLVGCFTTPRAKLSLSYLYIGLEIIPFMPLIPFFDWSIDKNNGAKIAYFLHYTEQTTPTAMMVGNIALTH